MIGTKALKYTGSLKIKKKMFYMLNPLSSFVLCSEYVCKCLVAKSSYLKPILIQDVCGAMN